MIEAAFAFARGPQCFDFRFASAAPILGIFGASGSGKTSLLHAIAGLLPTTAARLVVDGELVVDAAAGLRPPAHRRGVAMVFQEPRLFPHRSVSANLRYGERLVPVGRRRVAFDQVVDLLDLGALLLQRPGQLSGGERQRVALGRALLCSPRLLVCDEALAGLDRGRKRELLRYLRRVPELLRAPLLVVSHDLGELLQLGSELALVGEGSIAACAALGSLVRDPELLSRLHDLGLLNALRGTVHESTPERLSVRIGDHELRVSPTPSSPGDAVVVGLRPDDVALARAPVEGTSYRNQLPATVSFVTHSAGRCVVGLDIGVELLAQVSHQAIHELGLEPGARCVALIKAEAAQVL